MTLFIAFVLFSVVNPIVDKLHNHHVPRPLGVMVIYLLLFTVVISTFVLLVPPVIDQTRDLLKSFPEYADKTLLGFSQIKEYSAQYGILDDVKNNLDAVQEGIGGGVKGVFSMVSDIFGGVARFFIILVIAFYMVVDRGSLGGFLGNIIPVTYKNRVLADIRGIQEKLGLWARAQLILSVVIFVLTFVLLSIFKIKYALVLALLAGLTEFIPYLGPILSAIPAVFLGFLQSPVSALIVLGIYFVVQQIENIVLVPQVMKKAVGINPIISIIALMSGFKLAGIFGAVIAIPFVVAVSVLINDVSTRRTDKKPIS